jgi:FMN phosphatase YigB (HAD superfamily)
LKLTLLLDLDDTLLQNSMHTFLPGYLKAWGEYIAPKIEPQRFVKALLAGTRAITEQAYPDCSLRATFNSTFYPLIGMSPEEFQPLEDQFYRQIFPRLKALSQPVPGAVEFIESAFERNYQIAIATNPFFPLTAIEQRLEWAGLSIDRYQFALVPSIDKFHFGKPNTAYFAELMAYLGWPGGSTIMVGNDPENDIFPADQFGLPTFWIAKDDDPPLENLLMPHAKGGFNNLMNWLDQWHDHDLQPDLTTPVALLATLRSTPAALSSLCNLLDDQQWTNHPQPGEWCPAEIICHLRDVDIEVNIPRLQKMLAEDNPFLTGMDTDRWIEERRYHFQDGPLALQSFVAARMNLLLLLDAIKPQGWQRTARHSIFGRTELSELVGFIAGHDRLHIQQLLQTTAT